MNLTTAVNEAYERARVAALPFVPTHAQVAEALQPVVNELLLLDKNTVVQIFIEQYRHGTWDQHVLAEVKSAWSMES